MIAYNLYNYIGGESSLPPQPQISEIVTLPDGDNIKITGFKFQNVSSVTSISVPNMINTKKVTKIDNSAFAKNMGNIQKVVIPFEFDWVKPNDTIYFANSITELEMTQPIQKTGIMPTIIGGVSKITLGGNLTSLINSYTYQPNFPITYNPLFNKDLFAYVANLGPYALTKISILGNEFPNLKTVSSNAFEGTRVLRGILNLPNLLSARENSFSGCNATEMRLPSLVNVIGRDVFYNNDNLVSLYVNNLTGFDTNSFGSSFPKLQHIYTNSDNVELLKNQFNNYNKPNLAALVEADPTGDK